jgi:pilus assembly protein FimV
VVDQYSENQYDDDLTVGADEYEYDHTDVVDLFEFSNREESPTSRLKTLILSIDWEITDEVLMEFNEELIYLEGMWSGEKINLVYVQALQNISKYIYQRKANSHPNAIKLLLKFYYNLEKIVSSEDLSEDQKKEILLEDVKRFDSLKRQIFHHTEASLTKDHKDGGQSLADQQTNENELLNLKATVLGIDWEITEEDLNDLRQEVVRLEGKFAESRPKLILLQGIGTLGAYIKAYKSNAHADAFKLLRLFFDSLEEIVKTPMSLEEEKEILFPAIEEFNSFKSMLGPTISSGAVTAEEDEVQPALADHDDEVQPALAGFQDEEVRGFQEEKEASELGSDGIIDVSSHIDSFFGESSEDTASEETADHISPASVDGGSVIPGVDVDYGDGEIDDTLSALFDDGADDEAESPEGLLTVDRELALQGVDVETEADDESDEDALPIMDSGILAPALGDGDQESSYSTTSLSAQAEEGSVDEQVHETLDEFFDDEEQGVESAIEQEHDIEPRSEVSSLEVGDEQQASDEEEVSDDVEPGPAASVIIDEGDDSVEEEEVVFELVTSPVDESDSVDESSAVLPEQVLAIGRYIDDLDLDFDEEIIENIALEIDQLRQHWADKTLEMSLLELFATVTQHIDRFRFDSDPEAYELLQSNYAALEMLEKGMLEQNQEVLFGEISKVLKWQQELLFQQIMPK